MKHYHPIFLFVFFCFFSMPVVYAGSYEKIAPGDTITLGEFVFDDDFVATTTLCTIGITDPLNVEVVSSTTPMTANADGWHYYNYVTALNAPSGVWPSVMICGTVQRGDFVKVDKSFIVDWAVVSTSTIKGVVDESLAVATSSLATVINSNTNAAVLSASSSLFATLPASVWSFSGRTLTSFGTLVSDIWTNGTRSLTSGVAIAGDIWASVTRTLTGAGLSSGQLAVQSDVTTASSSIAAIVNANTNSQIFTSIAQLSGWTVRMSDESALQAGKMYRTKVTVLNAAGTATDAFSVPKVTLYDSAEPTRNLIVSNANMTNIGTGVYEYTYQTSSGSTQGVWETVATIEVESGKTITTNDYWIVAGSPAQVIINSIIVNSRTDINANVTITNEGLAGYEYQYAWCVVSDINNACGGGDDTYYASAAKYINPGVDFNTTLTAIVPSDGTYYFKLLAYFGTERSGSSRVFTVSDTPPPPPPPPPPSPGGGGMTVVVVPPVSGGTCKGADLNGDNKVNTVDFSILLSFWKKNPPFRNTCVDINHDNKVNAQDFSIMLSQWGTAGKALPST